MKKKIHISLGALLIVFFALGVFFVGGVYIGYSQAPSILKVSTVSGKTPEVSTSADFSPFWKTWELINQKSPSAKEFTDQDRVWGAVKGLVSSLDDPYSEFFTPEESKEFAETINGSFAGVGMELGMKDKILTVIAPLKGTPAFNAGIKSGDKVLKIDGTVTFDMTINQAVRLIRGKEGTVVTLALLHEGARDPIEIKITRAIINVPVIDGKLRDDGIYVISLYSFGTNSAQLFESELRKFQNTGSTKLIIDLRGNPGGLLDASIDMASFFLPSGDVIVRENFGDNKEEKVYRSRGYNLFVKKPKIAILVDGGSASASEILAGALREHNVAKLFGTQTYGKGSVQELVSVTDDTTLKITIAKWLTPNGVSISKKGLLPDYDVKFTLDDEKAKRDPQIDKAVEFLKADK